MNSIKHKLGRQAFSTAFDVAYSKVGKDRDKALMDIWNMSVPYVKKTDVKIDFDRGEALVADPNSVLMKYAGRVIDELDKNVLKQGFMNFLYEAMLCGTKTMHKENVDVSITGNSTNPTRFQHPVAGTYKKERIEQGKKYFSVASGGGTGRTLHPDNMAAGPASYGMEGSGGILCPLLFDEEKLVLDDLVKELNLASLIVADAGLGTINSVVLTAKYMQAKGLAVKGIVLNNFHPGDIMEEDNRFMCEAMTGLKVLACVCSGDTELAMDADAIAQLYE